MKEYVLDTRKVVERRRLFLLPGVEALKELQTPSLHVRPFAPLVESVFLKRDEDTFASVLYRWQPSDFSREAGATHIQGKLSVNVW